MSNEPCKSRLEICHSGTGLSLICLGSGGQERGYVQLYTAKCGNGDLDLFVGLRRCEMKRSQLTVRL